MSLFNRLFGKKPPATPLDPAALMTAFQQFVMAGTWTESQRIVTQQPILLHAQADDLLWQLAAAQAGQYLALPDAGRYPPAPAQPALAPARRPGLGGLCLGQVVAA